MKDLINYIDELEDIMPERVRSVYIWGSGAKNLNKETLTNLDLVVVVDDLNGEDIFLCSKATNNWVRKKNNKIPVFLDSEELFATTDIYPMEFEDMKDCSFKIRGENLLSELKINPIDLKFQCKQETRKFLMRVRQIYIKIANSNYNISDVVSEIVASYLVIFRTILRLNKINVPKIDREVIFIVCELAKLNLEPFIFLLQCKNTKCKPKKQRIIEIISYLIDELTTLLEYINKL